MERLCGPPGADQHQDHPGLSGTTDGIKIGTIIVDQVLVLGHMPYHLLEQCITTLALMVVIRAEPRAEVTHVE